MSLPLLSLKRDSLVCLECRGGAMASQQLLPLPEKKKKPSTSAAPTTMRDLGDDILREIFLRLPSLVRAALACRAFLRAVRSSPAFRRRFRKLHPPPLLGLFLDLYGPAIPAFAPLRGRSDPDLSAAVHGADFFLTRLPDDDEGAAPEWDIRDFHDGYVVLVSYNTKQMAVYNPLTRALDLFPRPPAEICEEMYVEFHVLSSDEDHGLFRLVCVCHEKWGAQAAVFSAGTREWQIFPWMDADDDEYSTRNGTLVNGFVYWTQSSQAFARVLNTRTLRFSRIDLPPHIEGQRELMAGVTRDGKLCIICAVQLTLLLWVWRADDDGVERWMLDKTFPLSQAIDDALTRCSVVVVDADHVAVKIVAIIDGFVYLSTYCEMDHSLPCLFLSFCLETAELKKLCPILHAATSYPYIMPCPSSLVCNKVNPRLEGA